jgi:hypothetical protein
MNFNSNCSLINVMSSLGHLVCAFMCVCFSMALPAHSGPRPLIQFRNHFSQTVGLLGRLIRPSQSHYLNTGQHKHRINAYTHQTSMPWVGFELTLPASKRAKTVHASDRTATVTGSEYIYIYKEKKDTKRRKVELVDRAKNLFLPEQRKCIYLHIF